MAKFLACNMRQQRVPPVSGPYGYRMTDFILCSQFYYDFFFRSAFSRLVVRSAVARQHFGDHDDGDAAAASLGLVIIAALEASIKK